MSDAKPKRAFSPAQREAQRRFMERYAPKTDIHGLGPRYVDQDLVGRLLYHRRLGVILEYRWSARALPVADDECETVHGGVLVRKASGIGVALGGEWAAPANRLSVVEPAPA